MKYSNSRVTAMLFSPITSQAHLLLCMALCLLGLALVSVTTTAVLAQHLLMGAVWLGISRIFDKQLLRWYWFTVAGLVVLVLGLDVAGYLL